MRKRKRYLFYKHLVLIDVFWCVPNEQNLLTTASSSSLIERVKVEEDIKLLSRLMTLFWLGN